MSYETYLTALHLSAEDYPFYALIQAAMRKADSDNAWKLQHEWPDVWAELQSRYNAPGGHLPGELNHA